MSKSVMNRRTMIKAMLGGGIGGIIGGCKEKPLHAAKEERMLIELVRMRVTAYCPCEKCCGKWSDGITASGHEIKLYDRFVAADKKYQFNTLMYIPGYTYTNIYKFSCLVSFTPVLDRGGAIKGNRIDVYFDTHQKALNWGVQYLDVTVYHVNEKGA